MGRGERLRVGIAAVTSAAMAAFGICLPAAAASDRDAATSLVRAAGEREASGLELGELKFGASRLVNWSKETDSEVDDLAEVNDDVVGLLGQQVGRGNQGDEFFEVFSSTKREIPEVDRSVRSLKSYAQSVVKSKKKKGSGVIKKEFGRLQSLTFNAVEAAGDVQSALLGPMVHLENYFLMLGIQEGAEAARRLDEQLIDLSRTMSEGPAIIQGIR